MSNNVPAQLEERTNEILDAVKDLDSDSVLVFVEHLWMWSIKSKYMQAAASRELARIDEVRK